MQNPSADSKLLDRQTKKLREIIQRWIKAEDHSMFHAGAVPSAWGGTLRGSRFPWPQMAHRVEMDDNGRAFLIYRYGGG